jgi:hypothetical protein
LPQTIVVGLHLVAVRAPTLDLALLIRAVMPPGAGRLGDGDLIVAGTGARHFRADVGFGIGIVAQGAFLLDGGRAGVKQVGCSHGGRPFLVVAARDHAQDQ